MWVESHLELCQITNNQINHNLIKIIQLSLTIFDLWSHSHLWVVGWMDILTFFDIFLKPPQPFTGLFLFFVFTPTQFQPPTQLDYTQISNNSIGLESIKIIQFYLKI